MTEAEIDALARRLAAGERRALARAITLAESTRPDHRAATRQLLQRFGQEGIGQGETGAIRIGLSGSPGVGKSTFIEVFGTMLVEQGLKVAVLAVDPASARPRGSILGGKARMGRLGRSPNAFIRPPPSPTELGGGGRGPPGGGSPAGGAGFGRRLVGRLRVSFPLKRVRVGVGAFRADRPGVRCPF